MTVAVSAFAIIVTLFCFYIVKEKRQSKQFNCGVVEEQPVCGNYLRQISSGVEFNKTGEQLFTNNCRACHSIHDVVVGPALKDVGKRRPKKWLYKFINKSNAVIKSGDPYAVELYNKYAKTEMKEFNFTKAEIDSILEYIDGYSHQGY
ncbi:c-type cytochrome [Sporocytophaga myxococcoides]|uniref:c-type cytochrome n=1 Tax=Sporocytophaga myxococcoides TaxID=153721 RepID=UPI00138AC58E|nr:cytochrome c [Sporocytophaga myxococcoides]